MHTGTHLDASESVLFYVVKCLAVEQLAYKFQATCLRCARQAYPTCQRLDSSASSNWARYQHAEMPKPEIE